MNPLSSLVPTPWSRGLGWVALAAMLGGAGPARAADAPAASPAAPMTMSHAPKAQLATGAAFDPQGRLWIVGLDEQGRLFTRHAPGQAMTTWSAPRLLETGGDAISADGENRPKLAFGPHDWAVISYTQPLKKPYTGFIRMLRSTDGGQTFSAPFTVHQDRQEITHRFESIAFDATGRLHTLWIDKRDLPPPGSERSYVGAAIYRNTSVDGGASFGPDTKVADHTCECCRIGIAPDAQGVPHALWRHVFGEQTRDHAMAALTDSPQPPPITRATEDDWQVNACPHHGPGLATAQDDGGFHAVWFGIRKEGGHDHPAVRYGRLTAEGAPVPGSVRALPDPRAEHADVAAYRRHVAIVWRSTDGQRTTLKAWVSRDAGATFEVRTLATAQGYNDHPRLVQSGPKMVVVWRLPQEVQVHDIAF
jgi:hypothetical protein